MEKIQYTTERGITIGIMPIPLLLETIRKAHVISGPPTYTEMQAGGATREIALTESDMALAQVENPEWYEEHRADWEAWEHERDTILEKLNDRLWEAVLRRAIVMELPSDDSWMAEQESFGLTIPQDVKERRIHYIRTEVIGGLHDILKITAIANGADLSEEAVSLAEASFRYSMAGSSLERLADEIGAMAPGSASRIDEDSKGMASAAK